MDLDVYEAVSSLSLGLSKETAPKVTGRLGDCMSDHEGCCKEALPHAMVFGAQQRAGGRGPRFPGCPGPAAAV